MTWSNQIKWNVKTKLMSDLIELSHSKENKRPKVNLNKNSKNIFEQCCLWNAHDSDTSYFCKTWDDCIQFQSNYFCAYHHPIVISSQMYCTRLILQVTHFCNYTVADWFFKTTLFLLNWTLYANVSILLNKTGFWNRKCLIWKIFVISKKCYW